jgi:hypothetical protein
MLSLWLSVVLRSDFVDESPLSSGLFYGAVHREPHPGWVRVNGVGQRRGACFMVGFERPLCRHITLPC